MIKIDNSLLEELGLGGLDDDEKKSLLEHLYSELELRVGTTISAELSNEQLDEFEALIDSNSEDKALKWLENNYPDYKKVVQQEFDKIKEELRVKAPDLLQKDS